MFELRHKITTNVQHWQIFRPKDARRWGSGPVWPRFCHRPLVSFVNKQYRAWLLQCTGCTGWASASVSAVCVRLAFYAPKRAFLPGVTGRLALRDSLFRAPRRGRPPWQAPALAIDVNLIHGPRTVMPVGQGLQRGKRGARVTMPPALIHGGLQGGARQVQAVGTYPFRPPHRPAQGCRFSPFRPKTCKCGKKAVTLRQICDDT